MIKTLLLLLGVSVSYGSFAGGWIQKSDFAGIPRHRTTMLSIGNCVYAGLGHYNGAGPNVLFEDWWEYNPATNAWTQKANYMGGPTYHAASFTINNKGYVGTGRIDFPSIQLVKDFYSYDPVTNMWTQLPDFPGSGRRGGVAFAIGDYGYMGTGSYTNDFYRYDPVAGSWSSIAPMPTGGRISAVGFDLDGYGYVGTGSVSGATNDFWRYDPVTNNWAQMANVGPTPRQEASGFAVGGKAYILTGDNYSSGTNYQDMWEYDPPTNTWIQLEDFKGAARRYLSSIRHGNYAYAGLGTSGTNYKDFWLFDQTLSLLERNLDNISLTAYPNPATDYFKLKFEGLDGVTMSNIEVTVTSITGQEVHRADLTSDEMIIDATNFKSGMYIYNLLYDNKILKSNQLIVR